MCLAGTHTHRKTAVTSGSKSGFFATSVLGLNSFKVTVRPGDLSQAPALRLFQEAVAAVSRSHCPMSGCVQVERPCHLPPHRTGPTTFGIPSTHLLRTRCSAWPHHVDVGVGKKSMWSEYAGLHFRMVLAGDSSLPVRAEEVGAPCRMLGHSALGLELASHPGTRQVCSSLCCSSDPSWEDLSPFQTSPRPAALSLGLSTF